MAQYIEKDALVAEIKRHISIAESQLALFGNEDERNRIMWAQQKKVCEIILSYLDSLEVKEVDLEKETKEWWKERLHLNPENQLWMDAHQSVELAKHFFELGLQASNPITAADRGTAEEIIINLKRVESDYRINLTKEIEWIRNQVKKGEEV